LVFAIVVYSERPRARRCAVLKTKFRDSFTDRSNVAGIAHGQTFDPGLDASPRSQIAKGVEPLREDIGLTDLNHVQV
jgi:hypothetical protein